MCKVYPFNPGPTQVNWAVVTFTGFQICSKFHDSLKYYEAWLVQGILTIETTVVIVNNVFGPQPFLPGIETMWIL